MTRKWPPCYHQLLNPTHHKRLQKTPDKCVFISIGWERCRRQISSSIPHPPCMHILLVDHIFNGVNAQIVEGWLELLLRGVSESLQCNMQLKALVTQIVAVGRCFKGHPSTTLCYGVSGGFRCCWLYMCVQSYWIKFCCCIFVFFYGNVYLILFRDTWSFRKYSNHTVTWNSSVFIVSCSR